MEREKETLLHFIKNRGNCQPIPCTCCPKPIKKFCDNVIRSVNVSSYNKKETIINHSYETAIGLYIEIYGKDDLVSELI